MDLETPVSRSNLGILVNPSPARTATFSIEVAKARLDNKARQRGPWTADGWAGFSTL